jgi:hypothetical protein
MARKRQVKEGWFYHRNGSRELMCPYGWYLTDPDDQAWRTWFQSKLSTQIAATHTDGAFLDSVSVPNYFGGSSWDPPLPDVSSAFESKWTKKIGRWLPAVTGSLGRPVVVNAGEWINARDQTDYSGATGLDRGVRSAGASEPADPRRLGASD